MPTEDMKKDATTNKDAEPKLELTQSYEYLVVFSLYSTNYMVIPNLPDEPDGSRPKQTWTYTWYLHWPNSTKVEERSGDISTSTLFNELGKDGWKLITSDILALMQGDVSNHYGWAEVGTPVLQRFIFMRRRNL